MHAYDIECQTVSRMKRHGWINVFNVLVEIEKVKINDANNPRERDDMLSPGIRSRNLSKTSPKFQSALSGSSPINTLPILISSGHFTNHVELEEGML